MAIAIEFEPDKILVEFLRVFVPEPDRVDFTDRQTLITGETFNGDGATVTFTMANRLWAINEVSISSVVQEKYAQYSYNLRDGTIEFATAPPIGVNNISVDYITGTTNWIFPDRPEENLTKKSFPRISVTQIDESSEALGMFDNSTWDTLTFQIDTWTKRDLRITFNSKQYTDQDVVDLIARQIQEGLKENWRDNLKGVLFYPQKITSSPVDYDRDKGIYRVTVRYTMRAQDAGEYTGV